MCMTEDELFKTNDEELMRLLKRAVVLDTKKAGNGKNSLDEKQLEEEILRRMKSRHS